MATTPVSTVTILDQDEGRHLFDREAQRLLGISGDEFLRRWEAGEYDADPDRPEIMSLAMLIPFAQ
jgi:hypothetical protein